MNKSILREFFDNGIFPAENISPKDPEYCEVKRKISDEIAHFKEILSPDEQKRLEELDNLYSRVTSLYGYECFAYGFKLATSLLSEAFTGMDELPNGD